MAGKVAPGGADRFRRRHNADGAMEYWLESAELVGIRREAGVQDPYWTPPLGWKPGDSPTQDPVCARELKQLKEDMAQMKRATEELASKKRGEGLITAGEDSSIVCQENAVRQAAEGGFQGRANKASDTCYAFWVGGVLRILGAYKFIDEKALRRFLLTCQSREDPNDRPHMSSVALMLGSKWVVLPKPSSPPFSVGKSFMHDQSSTSSYLGQKRA